MDFVKGFVKPELNEGQQSLLDLWVKEQSESEDWREPARIDKVEVHGDDEILIYVSRFIQLDYQGSSMTPVRHLQLMTVDRMWDSDDPQGDKLLLGNGHETVSYREVLLTNVYRTFQGDPGWRISSTEFQADPSPLHTDWVLPQ